MKEKIRCRVICAFLLAAMLFAMLCTPVFADGATAADKKTVRVSCGMNNALYLDDNGKPAGYLAYYVGQLAYLANWQLEYVEGSWNECVQNLYDGKIDLLFPTQKTDGRMDKMAFSEYIGGYQPIALYASEDADIYYEDFSAYNGKKVAISPGTSNQILLDDYAKKNGFTYIPVEIDSIEGKNEALANGSVDMIVFSTLNEVPNAKIVSLLDYLPYYFSTRIEDTELIDEVNNAMKAILAENPNVASNVYEAVLKGSAPLSYTKEENETIKATDSIKIGIYDNSLPLSGRDAEGNAVGIYIDLLKSIEEESGISIEPVLVARSEPLYSKMDDGEVDFVIGSKSLAYNEDDVSRYMCSESIIDYITVAVTRTDYSFDEKESPVFIITRARKYLESDILEKFANAEIKYCDNAKDCFIAVQSGKADVTLVNTWEFNYQSKNPRFAGMMEWESMRETSDLVLGVKKGTDATLLTIMEKAIDRVAGEDKNKIISTSLNMPYASYSASDYWYNIKTPVLAVGTVVILVAVCLFSYLYMRRKHTEELEVKNAQLEKSNKAKDTFLSRMSHELRTPLNAINGYAVVMDQSVIEHKYDEEKSHSYLKSIMMAVKYQLAIIGDLLDIQKIESGKMELVPADIDFDAYIRNIASMIEHDAEEKGVEFVCEKPDFTHETYIMDGVRLQQVLLNLLHNAVKFTPTGGKVKMTVRVLKQNDNENSLEFVISDTGIGMSDEFLEKQLFRKFAQEYTGNTSPYEGTGTGLAISNEIIKLMGGDIECESKKGEGTVFTVKLPATNPEKKEKRRKPRDFSCFDLSGVNVLLCEDNQMNQDIEKRLLEKMNCTVDIASDGKIGVEMFEQSAAGSYSVVLMDIRMPNMDGLEATEKIRAMPRDDAKSVPIFAVSANTFPEDIEKSLAAGMNEHLGKPVSAEILYENIKKYCLPDRSKA